MGSLVLKVQQFGEWPYFCPMCDTMTSLLVSFISIFLHYEIARNSTHHQAVVKTNQFIRVKPISVSEYSHSF